jgi:hypothetical protein
LILFNKSLLNICWSKNNETELPSGQQPDYKRRGPFDARSVIFDFPHSAVASSDISHLVFFKYSMGRLVGKAARGLNKAIRFLSSSILDVDAPSLSTSMIERHKLHASIGRKFSDSSRD